MKWMIADAMLNTLMPRVAKAAIKLFVERGIEGTTIKDIAQSADVSVGALYNHFKGKEELAWRIFTDHLHDFTRELTELMGEKTASRDKLAALVRACLAAFEEERDLFVYLILSEHREFRHYPKDKAHPGTVIDAMIRQGQEKGEIRDGSPTVLGSVVLGSIMRVCLSRMYGFIPEDLRSHEPALVDALWSAVKK